MGQKSRKVSRRAFLNLGAAAAAAPVVAGLAAPHTTAAQAATAVDGSLVEVGIGALQAGMQSGELSAHSIVQTYLDRIAAIDQGGPQLRSVLEVNPDALNIAAALDAERAERGPRGPLHGIPVLLKDNIDTDDAMLTTAGSLALVGTRPTQDATVAARLRAAGAVLLGKTNLSEWANIRAARSSSGWSGRGRQTKNPYALDRNPCGSSSGSAVAVAASLCAAALGTETDGSIVCPSATCGVVGIKPTVGLTSRAGVIPIAESQDTVGPHARSVADAALVLAALVGPDERDAATAESAGRFPSDISALLDVNGLQGARIGVPRNAGFWGYDPATDRIVEEAIALMRSLGATIVDPTDFPNPETLGADELTVLLYEFKDNLNRYLATRVPNPQYPNGPRPLTLADIIAFNEAVAADEMPYFGQELFLQAQELGPLTEQVYIEAQARNRAAGRDAINTVMDEYQLDALVAPTGSPAWTTDLLLGDRFLGASSTPAAIAGYPIITVPVGYWYELPIGMSLMGRAYSEPKLISLAYAYEQAAKLRRAPQYLPTLQLP